MIETTHFRSFHLICSLFRFFWTNASPMCAFGILFFAILREFLFLALGLPHAVLNDNKSNESEAII